MSTILATICRNATRKGILQHPQNNDLASIFELFVGALCRRKEEMEIDGDGPGIYLFTNALCEHPCVCGKSGIFGISWWGSKERFCSKVVFLRDAWKNGKPYLVRQLVQKKEIYNKSNKKNAFELPDKLMNYLFRPPCSSYIIKNVF